ncbi:MAG: 16S rRNA (cytosine(1402)-N(4))-methyltransferase RsmH [bacterium]|nr:16S rRNA (cytosine(1402)-N(4))-methyltransferase RsmH [bacterium]
MSHEPVLCRESVEFLTQAGPGLIVDATLGAGGHTEALLKADPAIRILGIDQDPLALEMAQARLGDLGDRVVFIAGNFGDLTDLIAEEAPNGVQGVLLDLGVSSMQIDRADRGFSFMREGPLDMRMNQSANASATDLLREIELDPLQKLLSEFGEVRKARRIARAVLVQRDAGNMASTAHLRTAVEGVVGQRDSHAELARVFQALRIAVNGEMKVLDRALAALPEVLTIGGIAVVISYHSLEDRRVKQMFKLESTGCLCPPELPLCNCGHEPRFKTLFNGIMSPDEDEIARNPRARSARLRAVRRIGK